ncbi:MAG TPA: hypothetical protein VGL82_02975 [Bryobacteraceae bacterium]
MKTTVEITDSLLEQAKELAAIRSTTLRQIIEEGLRNVIEIKQQHPFLLRDGSFGGQGMVRKMTWDEIRNEIYQGRGA